MSCLGVNLKEYCEANNILQVLEEWDYKKNENPPEYYAPNTNIKVWWICPKGHEYDASIGNRIRGTGCPYCRNLRIDKSNSLRALFPDIAKEWDYEKNGSVTPENVGAGTHKKYWWKCTKGHSFFSGVVTRTSGQCVCPYCSNKKILIGYNDLATTNPEVLKEWDYENNVIKPTETTFGVNRKVWWVCDKGHHYEASVGSHIKGTGCPYCSGLKASVTNNLALIKPNTAKMWDYENNYPSVPEEVSPKSSKSYYWKCSKGHSWKAKVSDLTSQDRGCPYCSGKRACDENNLEICFPEIAKEWDCEKNNLLPKDVTPYSGRKVWWKCKKGHSWESAVGNRTSNNSGCPYCNNQSTSFPEQAILFYCKQIFTKVNSRDTEAIGAELDIYIPEIKTAIEYDGLRWHQGEIIESKEKIKDKLCEDKGIKLFRVIEHGIDREHIDSVVCIYVKKNYLPDIENAIRELVSTISPENNIDINLKRDQIKIKENYLILDVQNSLAVVYPAIAQQWDYKKNGTLKPELFSSGSHQKVWWKCSEGHGWLASIQSRSKGNNCPYCSHKLASPEYNLKTEYPQLIEEWDYENNGKVLPDKLLPKSAKKVWWRCKDGHSWLMPITHRTTGGCNCPYCSGHRLSEDNNLEAVYPNIAAEWDYEKNNPVIPSEIPKGSMTKYWWKCPKGHNYNMTVNARTAQGQNCPYCAGKRFDNSNSLAGKYPGILKEWDYNKNSVSPSDVGANSDKKVWWICGNGHSYEARIANRVRGTKCPYCSGKVARKVQNIDTGEIYGDILEAAHSLGCSKSTVINLCNKTYESRKGIHLEYIDNK